MMSSGSCRLGRGCQSVHLLRIHTAPFRPTCRTLDRSRKPCGAVNPVQAFKVDEENRDTVYQGVYGPWKIEDRDRAEVRLKRARLHAEL